MRLVFTPFLRSIVLLLSLTIGLTSCKDKDITPVTDRDSQVRFDNISLQEFVYADYIRANVQLEFMVASDTSSTLTSMKLTDSFDLTNPIDYDRTYDFNLPENTKQCNFSIRIFVKNGYAETITIKNLVFIHNKNALMDKALSCYREELNEGTVFNFPVQSYEFD